MDALTKRQCLNIYMALLKYVCGIAKTLNLINRFNKIHPEVISNATLFSAIMVYFSDIAD